MIRRLKRRLKYHPFKRHVWNTKSISEDDVHYAYDSSLCFLDGCTAKKRTKIHWKSPEQVTRAAILRELGVTDISQLDAKREARLKELRER